MNRSKIISIIITLMLICLLTVFTVNKNKKIYIKSTDDIDNIKISMIKIEDGVNTVIKEVPTSGNWYMDYNCEDDNTKLYWDDGNKKILVKAAGNTECTVRFEKTKSAVNIVSMYVDDVYVGELEENKSYRLLSYECANGETVMWNGIESEVSVKPLRQNTHCKLYFEEAPYLYNRILLDNVAQSDSGINFTAVSSDTNGKGLYYTEDVQNYGEDYKKIYYYRGDVNNNWVSFGGYLWRIVRTTSENGVKLVYSGNAGGNASAFINTSSAFNTSSNKKYYVGYTYNTSGYTTLPQTNSTIKTAIDSWYNTNLSSYSNYLSPTAIYCNDRSTDSNYPAYDRLVTNKRPTYSCPETNASRYTVSEETGNGYLTYPIALLTADEASYAGIVFGEVSNLNSYIMDNSTANHWWIMSPYAYTGFYDSFIIASYGVLYNFHVNSIYGVRPSVSLKSCVTVTEGDGTLSSPYILSDKAC